VNRSLTHRTAIIALAAGLLGACTGSKGQVNPNKAAFESAIEATKDSIGLIAAYAPHLRNPAKETPGPYAPKRTTDIEQASYYAANEIRHAANRARQQVESSSADGVKALGAPLLKVAQVCADLKEPEQIDACVAAVQALDGALDQASKQAASAGVTAPFPRVAPASITDKAKASIAPFLKGIGPSDAEKDYLAKVPNAGASADDLLTACSAAAGEGKAIADEVQKVSEEMRKVAVHHYLAIESQCNRHGLANSAALGLEICLKEKEKKLPKPSTDCLSACGKVKKVVDDGVPAATFANLGAQYQELCEEKKK
jgi:hypothetical protein